MEFKKTEKVDVDTIVDKMFQDHPVELKKIKDNKKFLKEVEKKPLPVEVASIPVFGTSVDLNAQLKNNIWDRSAFFIDMECENFARMSYEQLKKYLAKKRKMPSNIIFILIILLGVGVGMIILILFLTGGISL